MGNETPTVKSNAAPVPTPVNDATPRVVADTPPAPSQMIAELPGWMRDALSAVRQGTSELLFRGTSDVIRSGPILPADAEPLKMLDRNVVRSQVVLTYRRYFMSQKAREQLADRGKLPLGDAMINGANVTEVNKITDDLIAEYNRRMATPEGRQELAVQWEGQRARGFLPAGGVPEGLILERSRVVWENDPVLSGEARATALLREAESRLADTFSYRDGLREMVRRF